MYHQNFPKDLMEHKNIIKEYKFIENSKGEGIKPLNFHRKPLNPKETLEYH
jgi:hypothetical protein